MLRLEPSYISRIFSMFGYDDAVVQDVRSGYRNTSYAAEASNSLMLNLLIHKSEPDALPRIRRTNTLGELLSEAGIPVRAPHDTRIVRIMVAGRPYHASLYNYLPGQTIPWEAYTMKHLKLLGWALGSLHAATRSLPNEQYPSVYDEYNAILGRMQIYFGNDQVAQAMGEKLGLQLRPEMLSMYESFLQACQKLPGAQLLHMDFVRGNVLFGDLSTDSPFRLGSVTLTGIIDFEKAAVGHPLFDVARTLAFLLVDCAAKTHGQIYKYFLQSGYIKRGGCTLSQTTVMINERTYDVLETAISMFLLYDFYKFLRANPYEALHENHHYMRTRDILVERGLLRSWRVH